ncbi:MAG: Asp23 family, cell envelope-related function, partial [Pseudonocardiales bacterium]|nr:Asp23 family, cell envelope-related function [Pseudonocardiales bacterium]
DVDGGLAFLEVELAVRWPAPVGRVTEEVRQHLFVQVRELLGLEVSEVNIQVVELPSEAASARVA